MKTLIVYFSQTGWTRGVAEQIRDRMQATTCPLVETRAREGVRGYLRSLFETALAGDAAIEALTVDPSRYDVVIVGTPVWAWHVSSPVRAFARRHAASIKRFACFCTMGGAGADSAFAELEQLLGTPPIATLALTDGEIAKGVAVPKVARFVQSVKRATHGAGDRGTPRRPPRPTLSMRAGSS